MKVDKPDLPSTMLRVRHGSAGLTGLIAGVLILGLLYFARHFFIPIALAFLLSFVLAPLVLRLRRWGVGRVSSVLVVVAFTFALILSLALFISTQLFELVNQLPNYRQNIQQKIESFQISKEGPFGRMNLMLHDLSQAVGAPTNRVSSATEKKSDKPVLVQVQASESTTLVLASHYLRPLLGPLATAGSVVVFVIFMLLQREDLRDRILGLIGEGRLSVSTRALDDAAQRVSRYLLMQLLVNAAYAIPFGIGLYFIGIPNAALWALLAGLLRFIPYVGPVIGAFMPVALAFAVHPGWMAVIETTALFVILELTVSNVIEPWLYGSSTGVSAIAILVAAVFWTWLWGPIGLLLSTPLTVCLVVMGRYIPHLSFLSVLLSDEQVLTTEAKFYQRMLAMDEEEMAQIIEEQLKTVSPESVFQEVIVPALVRTEKDRHSGALLELTVTSIVEHVRDLLEDIDRGLLSPAKKPEELQTEGERSSVILSPKVLCVPARSELDELTALMLKQLLEKRGVGAEVFAATKLVSECVEEVSSKSFQAICICAIPPTGIAAARSWCRRLKIPFPRIPILVGIWTEEENLQNISRRLGACRPESVVSNLSDAASRLISLLSLPIGDPNAAGPFPGHRVEDGGELQAESLVTAERGIANDPQPKLSG